MGAFLRGDTEAEKFLKNNPTTSVEEFNVEGRRVAFALYKRESTRVTFLRGWLQNADYHVFCKDRELAKNVANCLNAINIYDFEKKRAEREPHMNWLSPEREKRLYDNYEKAWEYLHAKGFKYEDYYMPGSRMWIREIVVTEEGYAEGRRTC